MDRFEHVSRDSEGNTGGLLQHPEHNSFHNLFSCGSTPSDEIAGRKC
jgi:hypothetical protein